MALLRSYNALYYSGQTEAWGTVRAVQPENQYRRTGNGDRIRLRFGLCSVALRGLGDRMLRLLQDVGTSYLWKLGARVHYRFSGAGCMIISWEVSVYRALSCVSCFLFLVSLVSLIFLFILFFLFLLVLLFLLFLCISLISLYLVSLQYFLYSILYLLHTFLMSYVHMIHGN